MNAKDITLNQVIDAHLLLAVANGHYAMSEINGGLGQLDSHITARVAFHHAAAYRDLRQWADSSQFARPNDSIAD